jgi:hypothetical protein
MRLFAIQSLSHLGRFAELRARQAAALRIALDHGDLYAVVNLRIGNPNLAWLTDGDSERARSECLEAMSAWSKRGFHIEHYYELLALTNVDLYERKGRDAHERVSEKLEAIRRSLLMRVQMVRMTVWLMQGRTALATAMDARGVERVRLLALAARSARRVAAERLPWGAAAAELLKGGVAKLEGDDSRAIVALTRALSEAERAKTALMAASAKHALGLCKGGDEGRRLTEESFAALGQAGAKEPERVIAMTAAGFVR